tara:strand:+ start:4222 stop:4635 length:414 start_codon:yes stop_codon:yes gene_type:complete
MMIYETEADRANESGVFGTIAKKYNCKVEKCEQLSYADGYLLYEDGSRGALVEVKKRNNAHNRYPTYMLSANKHRNLIDISTTQNIPALLFVGFTDGVYATKLKPEYPTGQGGRYDRNNPYDIENCIYIALDEFKQI